MPSAAADYKVVIGVLASCFANWNYLPDVLEKIRYAVAVGASPTRYEVQFQAKRNHTFSVCTGVK